MTAEERYLANEGLVFGYLNLFHPQLAHDDDSIQLAKLGLWLACSKYDESRDNAFSTFAYTVINHEFHKEFNKLYSKKRRANLNPSHLEDKIRDADELCIIDTISNPVEGPERFEEILAAHQSVEYIFSFMTPKQIRYLKTWMACDCNNTKAAEVLGITHQGMSEIIRNMRKRLACKKDRVYLV